MKWVPRIRDGYWLTPLQYKMAEVGWSVLGLIGVIKMYDCIMDNMYWMLGITGIILLGWMGAVQWTRYKNNYYEKMGTDEAKGTDRYDFVAYLLVPLIGCIVAGAIGFSVTDIAVAHQLFAGAEEECVVCALVSWLVYCLLDLGILRMLGKVEHFETVEKMAVETGEKVVKNAVTAVINGKTVTADKDTIMALLKETD